MKRGKCICIKHFKPTKWDPSFSGFKIGVTYDVKIYSNEDIMSHKVYGDRPHDAYFKKDGSYLFENYFLMVDDYREFQMNKLLNKDEI